MLFAHLTAVDGAIVLAYVLATTLLGAWFTRRQRDLNTYLVGDRDVRWWLVLVSIVATETSTVTFLSVPGLGFDRDGGNLAFLQLAFGYVIGRILIAWVLLPQYLSGNLLSAYQLLRQRFNPAVQRTASGIFLLTRAVADGLRLYLAALLLEQFTGWNTSASVLVIGLLTVVYTYLGGMQAVIWTDLIQFGVYITGALISAGYILAQTDGGLSGFLAAGRADHKFELLVFSADLTREYTFWAGLVGGAFFTMASHGADQMMVQRYLCSRSLREARLALVASGFVVLAQFLLFLLIGVGLFVLWRQGTLALPAGTRNDAVFGHFIVHFLPAGVVGLLVAAVLAASMASLASSLNSGAAAFVSDFYRPLRPSHSEGHYLRVSRLMTSFWGLTRVAVALLAVSLAGDSSVVRQVLTVAGLTTGMILGLFLLGSLRRPVGSRAALAGLVGGFLAVLAVWRLTPLAWPWYAPVGTLMTVGVALLLDRLRRALMDHLQTEGRNPASDNLDRLTPLQLVRLMNAEDARVIPAVAAQAEVIARAVEAIADRLRAGGRLVYAGAGTSGRLGVLDATECPPTFGAPPGQVVGVIAGGPAALTRAVEGAEDHPELAERDLEALGLGAGDVLVGIATSGRTPYVLGALDYARRRGAFTVGLSCNADAELTPRADVAITPVVGPEVLTGSTRLKAGTATKMVLNMLSTGAMVLLGKTFGNLMVDLRATNEKLRARANRIVRQLTGLDRPAAADLLGRCGGELKTALVAHLAAVPPEEARARLATAGGQVRGAVGRLSKPSGYSDGLESRPTAAPEASRTEALYLGIDGGGTRTVALLVRADAAGGWAVLGRGEAGPANPHAVGLERAQQALDEAVAGAFAAAGLPRAEVAAACLGLAGAGRPEDQAPVRAWADRVRLAGVVEVTADTPLLLAAGTPAGWGLALVAGTGSMAFARAPDGRTARSGGWGYLLGDEGSGYALAVAGLRAVARAADGRGPRTALSERLLAGLGVRQPQELIGAVYGGGLDRTALAALAPAVVAAAEDGDEEAADIVREAAGQLAATAAAAVHSLGLEALAVPTALAGGLLLGSPGYRRRVLDGLTGLGCRAEPVGLVREPAEGAVRLALALSGAASARRSFTGGLTPRRSPLC